MFISVFVQPTRQRTVWRIELRQRYQSKDQRGFMFFQLEYQSFDLFRRREHFPMTKLLKESFSFRLFEVDFIWFYKLGRTDIVTTGTSEIRIDSRFSPVSRNHTIYCKSMPCTQMISLNKLIHSFFDIWNIIIWNLIFFIVWNINKFIFSSLTRIFVDCTSLYWYDWCNRAEWWIRGRFCERLNLHRDLETFAIVGF